MKKLIFFIALLALLGGVVFYFMRPQSDPEANENNQSPDQSPESILVSQSISGSIATVEESCARITADTRLKSVLSKEVKAYHCQKAKKFIIFPGADRMHTFRIDPPGLEVSFKTPNDTIVVEDVKKFAPVGPHMIVETYTYTDSGAIKPSGAPGPAVSFFYEEPHSFYAITGSPKATEENFIADYPSILEKKRQVSSDKVLSIDTVSLGGKNGIRANIEDSRNGNVFSEIFFFKDSENYWRFFSRDEAVSNSLTVYQR